MSVVADTHAMIWYVDAPHELSTAATALALGLSLVTRDTEIRKLTNVTTIW